MRSCNEAGDVCKVARWGSLHDGYLGHGGKPGMRAEVDNSIIGQGGGVFSPHPYVWLERGSVHWFIVALSTEVVENERRRICRYSIVHVFIILSADLVNTLPDRL